MAKISLSLASNKNQFSQLYLKYKWPLLIALLAIVVNIDTLQYGFTFDDPLVLSNNKFVQEGIGAIPKIFSNTNMEGYNGEKESNYRPLSIGQFAMEYSLFGKNPTGFHFFQLVYYGLACALATLFLLMLFKSLPLWVPLSMALLYTLHPLHVEVVANIKSRDEIMGLIGILMTMILLLKEKKPMLHALFLGLAACIAFFSKESALPLVLAGPAVVYFFRNQSLVNIAKACWPIWVAAAFYLFMRQVIAATPGPDFRLEENALFVFTGPERWFAALGLVSHYLQLFLCPITLRADYSFDQLQLRSWSDPWSYLGMGITLLALWMILKGFKQRSFYSFALLFSMLFYIVTANLIVMTGATLAERFMFIPSLGLIIVLVYFIFKNIAPQISVHMRTVLIGILVVGCGVRTIVRNRDWVDNETIYRVTARDCQNSVRAQTKLARSMYDEAILPQNAALKSKYLADGMAVVDRSLKIYEKFALTHYVRGLMFKEQSRYQDAIHALGRAAQLNPSSSTYPMQAGLCYGYLGQDSLAMVQFKLAETKGSGSPITFHELARLHYNRGEYKTSLNYYLQVLNINALDVRALTQVTKIYRDNLNDMTKARIYNERLMKANTGK